MRKEEGRGKDSVVEGKSGEEVTWLCGGKPGNQIP